MKPFRWLFTLTFSVFLIGFAIGYPLGEALSSLVVKMLEESFSGFGADPVVIFAFILLNNVSKSFAAMLLGLGLGIVPILFVFLNGMILGLVGYYAVQSQGLPFFLLAILPHGIPELVALFLSAAIGIKLGLIVLGGFEGRASLKGEVTRAVKFFASRVFPLLLAAALIETFITPLVIWIFLL